MHQVTAKLGEQLRLAEEYGFGEVFLRIPVSEAREIQTMLANRDENASGGPSKQR